MKGRTRAIAAVVGTLLAGACASTSGGGEQAAGGADAIQQFVEIVNETPEPVTVTARVGAGAEQRLGRFGPAERRTVTISAVAAGTDPIFLWAANDRTGEQATTELPVTPGQILSWGIRFGN